MRDAMRRRETSMTRKMGDDKIGNDKEANTDMEIFHTTRCAYKNVYSFLGHLIYTSYDQFVNDIIYSPSMTCRNPTSAVAAHVRAWQRQLPETNSQSTEVLLLPAIVI